MEFSDDLKAMYGTALKREGKTMKFNFSNKKKKINEELVTPKDGEKKSDFISRFMSSDLAKKEFPDNKQRVAVAFSQWKKKDKLSESSGVVIRNGEYYIWNDGGTLSKLDNDDPRIPSNKNKEEPSSVSEKDKH